MMGTRTPCLSSCSTMCGTPFAAASLFTVTRTSSEPARASAATCCTVEDTSAVSVLVIDCTTTGASLPTRTPPILTVTAFLRWIVAIVNIQFSMGKRGAWMAPALLAEVQNACQRAQVQRVPDGRPRDVVKDDHGRKKDNEYESDLTNALFDLTLDVATKSALDKEQQDQTAVQDGNRQQVEDAQIEADQSGVEQQQEPPDLQ